MLDFMVEANRTGTYPNFKMDFSVDLAYHRHKRMPE